MRSPEVLSHWYLLMEDFEASAMEFYSALEDGVRRRNLPETSMSRVTWQEGGLATAKREYLRVTRARLAFDICAAPFGNGVFFSWWLARIPQRFAIVLLGLIVFGGMIAFGILWSVFGFSVSVVLLPLAFIGLGLLIREGTIPVEEAVLEIPLIGALYQRIFNPPTYYRLDTALMFQESVRNAVMEVVGEPRVGGIELERRVSAQRRA